MDRIATVGKAVATVAGIALSAPVSAAYLNIDDSDAMTITIAAGDFEEDLR